MISGILLLHSWKLTWKYLEASAISISQLIIRPGVVPLEFNYNDWPYYFNMVLQFESLSLSSQICLD